MIKFANLEYIDVTGGAGNDEFYIISTDPKVATSVYGDLGSDSFIVAPPSVPPVISKSLRGHRGILEHTVTSQDKGYDGLLVEGVAVNVLDNDGLGYISVIEEEPVHVMTEKTNDEFIFYIFPTMRPDSQVVVEVSPQSDIEGEPYLLLSNGTNAAFAEYDTLFVYFQQDEMEPIGVKVKHNSFAKALDVTDFSLLIRLSLSDRTMDERFLATEQSVLPIDVLLIPALDSANAKSVAIVEPTGKTAVIEGGDAATYDVYLRPCTTNFIGNVQVKVSQTVLNQVNLTGDISGDTINFSVDSYCKSTILVKARADLIQEGIHFVSLVHTVSGNASTLSDNSTLAATNVLVKINDIDMTGVVIDQPLALRTSEIDADDESLVGNSSFYEDEYKVRLTKAPANGTSVNIAIESIAVATDAKAQLLAAGITAEAEIAKRTAERQQVLVAVNGGTPAFTANLIFDETNWDAWMNITVKAFDDNITEGVDVLNFPTQPSFLSFIQGPLAMYGKGEFQVPDIQPPLLLPSENDTETIVFPGNVTVDLSSFDAIEEKQVDRLIVYNQNARGTAPSNGVLSVDQFTGMNMGRGIVVRTCTATSP